MFYAFIALVPIVVMLAAVALDTKNVDTHDNRTTLIKNEQAAAGIRPVEIYENIR